MSESPGIESILELARKREKEYDWPGAAESYVKAIGILPEQDASKTGEVRERLGYALFRAAMQSEGPEHFRERIQRSIHDYEQAGALYRRVDEPKLAARALRCEAMILHLRSWLASHPGEKKKLVDEAWSLTKNALRAFLEAEDAQEYGKTFNLLSVNAGFCFVLEWNPEDGEKILREAIVLGEQSVKFLINLGDKDELARTYARTSNNLDCLTGYIPEIEEQRNNLEKSAGYWVSANQLSEDSTLFELLSSPIPTVFSITSGSDEALRFFEKAVNYGRKTRDKRLLGAGLGMLDYQEFWKALAIEDSDQRIRLLETALQHADQARQQFSSISFISPQPAAFWPEGPRGDYYWQLAFYETDLASKRSLLELGLKAGREELQRGASSGYPGVICLAHHILSKILWSLSKIEAGSEEKTRLLDESLKHRKESVRLTEELNPYFFWNVGIMRNFMADVRSELANLSKDPETKRRELEEAAADKEASLILMAKDSEFRLETTGQFVQTQLVRVGISQYELGNLSTRLYDLTGNKGHLEKAASVFQQASESFQKLGHVSRIAECQWRKGQALDRLSENLRSAESFSLASSSYAAAAEKFALLKPFYNNYAFYMQAWAEIEKARYHHGRQEYGKAKKHYERAAELHKTTNQWSFLAPNYSAWAQIENGEDLSRKEHSVEALRAFQNAARLFKEAKKSTQAELSRIVSPDERLMATKLVNAADIREEYCTGRLVIEQAKILDKTGEHHSSAEKYGQAARAFEKLTQLLESEQDKSEAKLIMTLSRAWQTMARAEEQASPELYAEASHLFEEAKEESPNEKMSMLTMGHSRFCKALEAGTRFADTREDGLHTAATKHLESAANYYLKAGFQNASEFVEASKLLFDAYLHTDNANRETDQAKKTKLYLLAEKVLQVSADSFRKANYPAKREQALRPLGKVRKERELALSLTELLQAPSIVSATVALPAATPAHEKAVGLERFEHADIQASLITRRRSLKVGEEMDLEIELVNAGRGAAQLVKLEELIPDGFELTEKPEPYRVEDSYLNMKGKRLDPLKTEEVKLVLRPNVQGQFTLKPRILYLDESGKYKSHEPEPIEITVKELGLSGWLKGR